MFCCDVYNFAPIEKICQYDDFQIYASIIAPHVPCVGL